MVEKHNKPESAVTAPDTQDQPRLLCIGIDQIHTYERDPRIRKNPEYERIKRSIQAHGLEQPLIVSQRPGATGYVVSAGGNTRLKILKELYNASQDPDFSLVNCIEVRWQGERSMLAGHLRENTLRADLTFAEKAVAVCVFAEFLADENDGVPPTLEALRDELTQRGFPIGKTQLSYMRYTAETLMPAMPIALNDGLGSNTIARIRKLHLCARKFWERRDLGPGEEFDGIFAELCRRLDGPDWHFDLLQDSVEFEVAEAADLSIQAVRLNLQTAEFLALPAPVLRDTSSKHARVGSKTMRAREPENKKSKSSLSISVKLPNQGTKGSIAIRDPFLDLRRRVFGFALSLAGRYGLASLILPLPSVGNGFLVSDVPDIGDRVDAAYQAVIGTMWWQLIAFSETGNAPIHVINENLPKDSSLAAILREKKLELLFDRVEIINAPHFVDGFFANLSREEWQEWVALAETHRQIRAKVFETETPLWSVFS